VELNNEFEVAIPLAEAWAVLTDVEKIAPCMPGAELREVAGDEYRGIVKVKVGPITASYRGVARFEQLDAEAHKAVLKAEGRETRGQGNATALITATLSPSGKGTKVVVATDLAITGKVAQFGRGVLADVSGKLLDQFVHNLETTVLAVPGPVDTAGAAASDSAGEETSREEATVDSNGSAPTQPGERQESTAEPARRSKAQAPTPGEPAEAGEKAAMGAEEPAPLTPTAQSGPRRIESEPVEPVDLFEVAGESVLKRLAPYLTVAGILLIARIVVYSLRRRRR